MIYRQYGTAYHSVELNFDSKALNEIGFRRDREATLPTEELDAFETVDTCLDVFASAWDTMTVQAQRMEAAIDAGTLATELADFLVEKGVPFRDGHHVVGAVVRAAAEAGKPLTSLTLEELQQHHAAFDAEALSRLSPRASLTRRNLPGGTGPASVAAQIEQASAILEAAGG